MPLNQINEFLQWSLISHRKLESSYDVDDFIKRIPNIWNYFETKGVIPMVKLGM